jgi:hypothetical protein
MDQIIDTMKKANDIVQRYPEAHSLNDVIVALGSELADTQAKLDSMTEIAAEQKRRLEVLYDGTESTPALLTIARLEAKLDDTKEELAGKSKYVTDVMDANIKLRAKLEAVERESERLRGEGMRMLEIVECNDPGNAERFRAALTQEGEIDG